MFPTQLLDLHTNFIKTGEHRGIEDYHEMNETTDALLCVACRKLLGNLKKVVEVSYKVLTHTGVALGKEVPLPIVLVSDASLYTTLRNLLGIRRIWWRVVGG